MVVNERKPGGPFHCNRSKTEMNVRMLLNRCELIAKQEPVDGNWRLKKYVESLTEMLAELKTERSKPSRDDMGDYIKRVDFLNGVIKTSTLNDPMEKLEALQHLSHGAATVSADASAQEIHQRTVAKYGTELRSDLFGLDDTDDALRKRNIIKAPNFTRNSSGQEDIDTLLKYHQNMQEKVAENMVMLTKSLKEQSQIASTIIKRDTETLKKSSEMTDRNLDSLRAESDRLQVHSRSAWKCWLWLMLAVVAVIFINMVLFMKVMKKRKFENV